VRSHKVAWSRIGVAEPTAEQLIEHLATSFAALEGLPTQDTLVFERFFDEAGGMRLVIHSPFGGRINRAWGLALRKRFCRRFNFELQAAATEDNIMLSLTTTHIFELEEVARHLHSTNVRSLLIQAVLDAPMFSTRWRWVAGVALALPRFRGGRKVAPQLARMEADDLIAAVFPDQMACGETIAGDREIPDHPLTNQTIGDCLHGAMDIEGPERLLGRVETGESRVVTCDLTQPSPLALEVLSARPYAYLDEAPLEEHRTRGPPSARAGGCGRTWAPRRGGDRRETWPDPVNAEELHDALPWFGCLNDAEARAVPEWIGWLTELARIDRVIQIRTARAMLWVAAERLRQFRAVWPIASLSPDIVPQPDVPLPDILPLEGEGRVWSADEALVEILRGRLEGLGPVTAVALAAPLGLEPDEISAALIPLEVEGFVLRGRCTSEGNDGEWCDRRLLARIHRYTVRLCVPRSSRSPPGAWETETLPTRIAGYEPAWLDDQCLAGRVSWARLTPGRGNDRDRVATPMRTTPTTLPPRRQVQLWSTLAGEADGARSSGRARIVFDCLRSQGVSFFDELAAATGLMRMHVEEALAELVTLGLVPSDGFDELRALLVPSDRRKPFGGGTRRRRIMNFGMEDAGRWALVHRSTVFEPQARAASADHVAHTLLRRYGIVFWRLLAREADWLPPWRDLLRVFRRLEARGEIRGGRFVAGFSGEQFALPDAVGLLRSVRRRPASGEFVSLSGADPLNLAGVLTPGPNLAALTGSRLLFRNRLPVALLRGDDVRFLTDLDTATQWEARKNLPRSASPALLADLAWRLSRGAPATGLTTANPRCFENRHACVLFSSVSATWRLLVPAAETELCRRHELAGR